MSIEIAAATENFPDRIQAILPSPDILIRCQAVFAKNEFSPRLENPSHFRNNRCWFADVFQGHDVQAGVEAASDEGQG